MLALAKASAFKKDIMQMETPDHIKVCGYSLSMKDLRQIYAQEGFTSKDVPVRHAKLWESAGFVKTFYSGQILFFVLDPTDYDEILALNDCRADYTGSDCIFVGISEASA